MEYATIDDVTILFRKLTPEETERAKALIPIVCADLRTYAKTVGKDLDAMVQADQDLAAVAKSVTVDVVGRTLMTSTTGEPMTQISGSRRGPVYQKIGTGAPGAAPPAVRGDRLLWQSFFTESRWCCTAGCRRVLINLTLLSIPRHLRP